MRAFMQVPIQFSKEQRACFEQAAALVPAPVRVRFVDDLVAGACALLINLIYCCDQLLM